MKSKGCALFALFAAAALFVVAGCSDDSSEAFEEESVSTLSADTASSRTITADNVEELLQSIGKVAGNSKNDANYWDFASGELSADEDGAYTFTVSWAGNNTNTSDRHTWPTTSTTIASIQKIDTVSTSLLMADFSNTDWKHKPEAASGSGEDTAAKGDTTGTVTASIELADSSYAIPESLQTVTIALENEVWTYN